MAFFRNKIGWNAGGISGTQALNGSIKQCINTGEVIAKRGAGGIVASINDSTVQYCKNTGTICSTDIDHGSQSGGIVGFANWTDDGKILDCYNIGEVKSIEAAGGICGYQGGSGGTTRIENCYNIGTIVNTAVPVNNIGSGGIVGEKSAADPLSTLILLNNFWLENKGANFGVGEVINSNTNAEPKTITALQGLAETLGSAYKDDEKGENEGYPVLFWE